MPMFVRYYTFINHPFVDVRRILLDGRADWLAGFARDVNGSGSLAELRVAFRGANLQKTVTMDFAIPIHQGTLRTSLPFRWKASTMPTLFPSFDGDLQVSHWREATTQLALSANYQPPFGPVGFILEQAALHLVTEALVKDFVDRVAAAISAKLKTGVAAAV